jgi:hypothetical protein
VKTVWNRDHYGMVTWWTHGNSSMAVNTMSTTDAVDLNDAYPAMVFQGSCLNAWPEASDNLAYTLLKNGAVSTVAATRVSWYLYASDYSRGGDNGGRALEYTRAAVRDSMSCGEALT